MRIEFFLFSIFTILALLLSLILHSQHINFLYGIVVAFFVTIILYYSKILEMDYKVSKDDFWN